MLVAAQCAVEAPGLLLLGAEILHRLVIEQAVDGAGVCLSVGLVHGAAELEPPLGHRQGEGDVASDGDERHHREIHVVQRPQHAANHGDLEQRRRDVEQREAENELDALGAALDGAAETPRPAIEMEAQREAVQVTKGGERGGPHGALGDFGEHRVAQFAERPRHHAGDAVADDESHRHGHGRPELARERIHRPFVEEWDANVDDLCGDEKGQRDGYAHAQLDRPRRPQERQQRADRLDLFAARGPCRRIE